MNKPVTIGLTGGIGSGKSTVARMLEKRGYPVIDADMMGHQVLEFPHPGFREVIKAFGKGILDQHGKISRPKLGLIVFKDPQKLEKLNNISHPHIDRMIKQESLKLSKEHSSKIIFLEAALLIETGWQQKCSQVWVITSKESYIIQRLAIRNGMNASEAKRKIASQLSSDKRLIHADFVLENNGTEKDLEKKIDQAIKGFQKQLL